jgi:DNA-binding response OmpR family regulator
MNEDRKTVVIFEDAMTTQELLRLFFVKKGLRVKLYGDGEDAAARVRENDPALIMMDLMMPGRDGFEACAALRREAITTPIVVLSVLQDDEARQRALSLGADVYLVKPFIPAALEAIVGPLLRAR